MKHAGIFVMGFLSIFCFAAMLFLRSNDVWELVRRGDLNELGDFFAGVFTPLAFRLGEVAIDYNDRRVTVAGRLVRLTATEYELLRVLSANAGRITTYESLLLQVWGQDEIGDLRPMRSFVRNLRQKLCDDAASPAYIVNVRQVGYSMAKPRNL